MPKSRSNRKSHRLAVSFHKSFVPERRLIHAMLEFAASGGAGDVHAISAATGIPTGSSSGKVAPILDYCRGMGLLTLSSGRSAVKAPCLTPFGRAVLLDDPFLKSELTQWLAHVHLCDELNGAEVWYQTFWMGMARLGASFGRDELDAWLESACRKRQRSIIGPLLSMYQDEGAWGLCGAVKADGTRLVRRPMPVRSEFAWGYAAWILSAIDKIGRAREQITVDELNDACGWRRLSGWTPEEAERSLWLAECKGAIAVDRHMHPWIIRGTVTAPDAWRRLYSDMI